MFRELYKEANDNIKGDRAILDKAFLKAAQPEMKKSPLLKYSFVGTAAAAVLVLGAVFLNADIFMEKTQNMPTPDEIEKTVVTPTEKIHETNATLHYDTAEEAAVTADTAENSETVKRTETAHVANANDTVNEQSSIAVPELANEQPVAAMSLEEDLVAVAENQDAATSFTLRRPNTEVFDEADSAWETDAEAEADDSFNISEEPTETVRANKYASGGGSVAQSNTSSAKTDGDQLTAKVFSYMQDASMYDDSEQEEYKNTDVCPIESVETAIERAKNECTVEYDIADAYFDPVERIWKIAFSFAPSDDMVMAGGGQNVYMTEDGITILIVYGE